MKKIRPAQPVVPESVRRRPLKPVVVGVDGKEVATSRPALDRLFDEFDRLEHYRIAQDQADRFSAIVTDRGLTDSDLAYLSRVPFRIWTKLLPELQVKQSPGPRGDPELLRAVAALARKDKISPTAAAKELHDSDGRFSRAKKKHPELWRKLWPAAPG